MEDSGTDKSRKKTSSVWKYCEVIDSTFARCLICDHKLSYKSSVTNLRKHFKKKHPEAALPPNTTYKRNGVITLDSDDDEERMEAKRAASSVIVDYLRPAEENTSKPRHSMNYSRPSPIIKRDRSPIRYHEYPKIEPKCKQPDISEETEFDIFGRSVVLQLKQLPLVHALEVQAEIMNLLVQKRIQALRQSHETNTEDTPMQYALVYTESSESQDQIRTPEIAKDSDHQLKIM